MSAALEPIRRAALKTSLGHYPAVFAILDCVEFGLPQSFEGAMRSEMTSFSHLVLRPEPRAMIQTMFLGRVDYERLERKQQLPEVVAATVDRRAGGAGAQPRSSRRAGRGGLLRLRRGRAGARRARCRATGSMATTPRRPPRARCSRAFRRPSRRSAAGRSEEELRVADYAAVRQAGYPAYLGGPFAFAAARAP